MEKHFLSCPTHCSALNIFIFTAMTLHLEKHQERPALFTISPMPGMLFIFPYFFIVTLFFILHLSVLYSSYQNSYRGEITFSINALKINYFIFSFVLIFEV